MRRGTTPTLELALDVPIDGCEFHATIQNGDVQIDRTEQECTLSEDGKTILVELSQADTLSLDPGKIAYVQVRFKKDGKAYATTIAETSVGRILLDGEI